MTANTIKIIMLLVSASAISQTARAQYWDYVVTTKGDTIKCNIDKSRTRYKTADSKHFKDIDFDHISAYYSTDAGALYRAIVKPYENDEDTVYAKVAEKGKINLYQVKEKQSDTSPFNNVTQYKTVDIWYISKTPGHIESIKFDVWGTVPVNKRNSAFAEMIKDNKEIYNRYLSTDKTSIEAIQEMIYEYNKGGS
jgi:hypothetical protein